MQPTVIQGPAFVIFDSYTFYTKGNVTIRYQTKSWEPEVSSFGVLGPRHQSRSAVISFTPAGQIVQAALGVQTAIAKYWPKSPSSVGASVLGGSCSVVPAAGATETVTFARAGITKYAPMILSPLATCWGDMEITALGDSSAEPTDAAYLQTLGATVADGNFDETKIISPRYTAALGTSITGIEPDDGGFKVEPSISVRTMSCANYGDVDIILASLSMACSFRPVSWSSANMATHLKLEGASALRPGDAYAGSEDLVITSASVGLALTLPDMGVKDGGQIYGVAEWRAGEVTFVQKITSATGVPASLWSAA